MTGAPYEDHRPEPDPAERPVHIKAAATLLPLSAFLAGPIAVYDPAMTQAVYLLLFVTIGAAIRFCKGGRTARITATVTAALVLFYLSPFAILGLLNIGSVSSRTSGSRPSSPSSPPAPA